MSDAPDHRKYHLVLNLQADDLDEIERVFNQLVIDFMVEHNSLKDAGKIVDTHSGGWSSGYSLTVEHDPEMTGDRYRAELEAWRKARVEAARAS